MANFQVTTFYEFFELGGEQLAELQDKLTAFASERDIRGLLIIGAEGCNSTICGSAKAIA